MIVLLDTDRQKVLVYTESGMQMVSFANAEVLKRIIGNRQVTYVTQGMQTGAQEIIDVVNQLRGVPSDPVAAYQNSKNQSLYLRSTRRGVFSVQIAKDYSLVLNGPLHFVPVSTLPKNVLKTSETIRNLLDQNILQIVSQPEMQHLKEEAARLSQRGKRGRNNMIVDRNRDGDIIEDDENIPQNRRSQAGRSARGIDGTELDDVIEIDIGKGGFGRGGGRASNESTMLPPDFGS